MKYFFTILCFISCWTISNAQRVSTTITISKDTIHPGDQLELGMILKVPQNIDDLVLDFSPFDTLKNLGLADTMPQNPFFDIEWIEQNWTEGPKTIGITMEGESSGGIRQWTARFPITIWDIGIYRLPNPLVLNNEGKELDKVEGQSPIIFVMPPLEAAPADTTEFINDIQTIVPEKKNWRDYIWLYLLLLFLLLAILVLFLLARIKKKEQFKDVTPIIEPIIPAHEIALEKLEALRQSSSWKTGNSKEFQEKLTFIIREYLENKYKVPALESTTSEIVKSLNEISFDANYLPSLKNILQIADLVKFAKASPPESIHEEFLDTAVQFVRQTKDTVLEKTEEE